MEAAWLSTTGKKKGKKQFRTVIHAQAARAQAESWEVLKEKYNIKNKDAKQARGPKATPYTPPASYRRDTGPRHESKPDTIGVALKAPDKIYTGEAMIGIGQLHKSNAIPVFSKEDAIDISKMRRG